MGPPVEIAQKKCTGNVYTLITSYVLVVGAVAFILSPLPLFPLPL